MESQDTSHEHGMSHEDGPMQHSGHQRGMYLRFGAMLLTAMVVMYAAMFAGTYQWSHVRLSESRIFMALTMGGAMGIVMLAWMWKMYSNTKVNVAVVIASLLLLAAGVALDRSQVLVGDTGYMKSMIPHHSLAITRSERAHLDDVRVCELAQEISKSQREEILEMDWLIDDIKRNGAAESAADAEARPVPDFSRAAERTCPSR
ncbi:DUF305 domain-containing protein [Nocardioides sp. Kera G14]|uniref:DUF305 domain-containing protein n=1 Tax=Nocardioides sp. Kera G14 TaxID=2884264 RepID=UPI001D109CB0|nr:DUF305 domain-containing protein [Nocardioides sp. Kera G14]UDY24011.1 DUF305 domain-containing protein [Nocardioides sp. Kera G14]